MNSEVHQQTFWQDNIVLSRSPVENIYFILVPNQKCWAQSLRWAEMTVKSKNCPETSTCHAFILYNDESSNNRHYLKITYGPEENQVGATNECPKTALLCIFWDYIWTN